MNKNNSFGHKSLKVKYGTRVVGTLALATNGKVAFSYDDEWLAAGFSISPFSLPLEKRYLFRIRVILMGYLVYFRTVCPTPGGKFC